MNKLSDNFQKYFMAPTFENMDLEIAILNGIKKLEEENFKLSAGTCVVGEGIIAGEH